MTATQQACSNGNDTPPPREPREVIGLVADYAGQPPNIVIINADDLGYGDLASYGSKAIQTPHIDSLAQQGIRFTDFHACDSVCTPSRAGLLTGRYPKRMGLDVPLNPGSMSVLGQLTVSLGYLAGKLGLMDLATEGGATGLHGYEITLAEALKVRGYSTAMVGKWHLGDYGSNPEHDPREHGFDSYLGVPYSNDMHPFPLYRNGEQLEADVADQSTLTRRYTEEAIAFVESSRDGPFFLYFAHTFPHRPLYASEDFSNRSAAGVFGDTVEEIDWSVGQLLAVLKRNNLEDDTIVIFTSDNGPWYQGSPGTFRGRKGQSYEGGHRVPFIARWPNHISPGTVSDEPAMNIDIFPTSLALAGLEPPDDRVVDGKNIHGLLTVADAKSPHEALFFYHHGVLEGVRTGKWKYFRSINHYVWPLPVNKKIGNISEHTRGPLPLLFDLEIDPGEAYDVSAKHPDVSAALADRITEWEDALQSNRSGWKQ
ncbi:MAG: sulfatase [Polyangiales bacterium]